MTFQVKEQVAEKIFRRQLGRGISKAGMLLTRMQVMNSPNSNIIRPGSWRHHMDGKSRKLNPIPCYIFKKIIIKSMPIYLQIHGCILKYLQFLCIHYITVNQFTILKQNFNLSDIIFFINLLWITSLNKRQMAQWIKNPPAMQEMKEMRV